MIQMRACLDRTILGKAQFRDRQSHRHGFWMMLAEDAQLTGELQLSAFWELRGLVGAAGVEGAGGAVNPGPVPAGGIVVSDGPAQDPPIAYNNPAQALDNFPGVAAFESIVLATWADDEANGWDPMPVPTPTQRWLVDNISLSVGGAACMSLTDDAIVDGADLAMLLASWGAGPGNAADFTGDGVVNGADLATLLAGWGPCP